MNHPSIVVPSKNNRSFKRVYEEEDTMKVLIWSLKISFLTSVENANRKELVVIDSEKELITYMLSISKITRKLVSFLSISDILNYLQAMKPKLLKKSFILTHNIYRVATENLIATNFPDPERVPRKLSLSESGFAPLRKKENTDLQDAVASINLLKFWNLFIYFEQLTIDDDFKNNSLRKSVNEFHINDDIGRTFPNVMGEEDIQDILKSVLTALSNSVPQLGYIQGLNSIAGALIINLISVPNFLRNFGSVTVKEIVYGCLKYIMIQRDFFTFFTDGFVKYVMVCNQLQLLLRPRMPDLYAHFVSLV